VARLVGDHNSYIVPDSRGIDLESTLDGGQAFRWYRSPETGYRGVIGDVVYLIYTGDSGVEFEVVSGTAPDDPAAIISDYLGRNSDFAGFMGRYKGDDVIGPALVAWDGLRVLRQDPWENLVAFITSATSNVPRIKLNVGSIACELGDRIGEGERDFRFPSPTAIRDAGDDRLRELRLGFRAPYIVEAAERVADGRLPIYELREAGYAEARAALMAIKGIGEKVADCVLAFSLDKGEAFPIDRWIERALVQWYGMPENKNKSAAADWARDRFGTDAAYVNQYLFHRQRMEGRGIASAAK
jgi:N-glycosylase/DNA lyase